MKAGAFAAVLLLLSGTAVAAAAPDIHKVNGRIDIASSETVGDVSTVNGSIHIGDKAVSGGVHTVNGRIDLDASASAQSLRTVNGAIVIGAGAHVAGKVTTVNGTIDLRPAADVSGPLSNINGRITLAAAHVGGEISTVTGDIDIHGQSRVDDGILVRHACCWHPILRWFGITHEPTVIIGPGVIVRGPLTFERRVHLYVSASAHIGPVKGATPMVYSGTQPESTAKLSNNMRAIATAAGMRTMQKQVHAESRGEVRIYNDAGSINVVGWDKPLVSASAELYGSSLGLHVSASDDGTAVRITGYPHGWLGIFDWTALRKADLTVYVPHLSSVTVVAVSARVRSTNLQGPQRLASVSGTVNAHVAAAAVYTHTVSGQITLRGEGQHALLQASSVSGPIDVDAGSGDFKAQSVSGAMRALLSSAHEVSMSSISGAIRIQAGLTPGATLTVSSVSGRVAVSAPASTGFSYQISSLSGSVHDCFGALSQARTSTRPGTVLSGTRGAGGAQIRIRTLSGAVSLCDR